MPAILLRFAPHALVLLAAGMAIWWIDHRGHSRAIAEREASDARLIALMRADLRRSEQALAAGIDRIAHQYDAARAASEARRAALQPILIREIARESRLSDPDLGLTPGLLDAVNAARAAGACAAAPPGSAACALPAAAADR